MCPRRGIDPASGHPRAQKPPLGRGPSPPVWDGRLDATGQRRGKLPSSAWTQHRAVKQGKSGGSVGTTDQGKGKGSREGKTGQGGGGRTRGGERPGGTTAYGGKGSKGRAANGDRPIGAARCRREQYTEGDMPTPPPFFRVSPKYLKSMNNVSTVLYPVHCDYIAHCLIPFHITMLYTALRDGMKQRSLAIVPTKCKTGVFLTAAVVGVYLWLAVSDCHTAPHHTHVPQRPPAASTMCPPHTNNVSQSFWIHLIPKTGAHGHCVFGGGGFGMMPWCVVLVCSGRRLLADRHSLPFPWTLSLHRRWCPSASHHPLTFLFLHALPSLSPSPSLPLAFPSVRGVCVCSACVDVRCCALSVTRHVFAGISHTPSPCSSRRSP